jgi:hypothetical protein
MPDAEYDLSLPGLTRRVGEFLGRIQDMGSDERVLLLGAFAGVVSRMQAEAGTVTVADRDYLDPVLGCDEMRALERSDPEAWGQAGALITRAFLAGKAAACASPEP